MQGAPSASVRRRGAPRLALGMALAMMAAGLPERAAAAVVEVPSDGEALVRAIASAAPGDVLRLKPGRHQGPVVIDRPLVLEGEPGAVVDGRRLGSVITVTAPNVTIRGLEIRDGGADQDQKPAGVHLERAAAGAVVEHNRLVDNRNGIVVSGAAQVTIRRNTVIGRKDLRLDHQGNGIQVTSAPGAQVVENNVSFSHDGILATTARKARLAANRISNVRFAVHVMYANDLQVSGNASYGNEFGYALMNATGLVVRHNLSEGDRYQGIAINYVNGSLIERNVVRGGPERCLFIFNSNANGFSDNRFEGCETGVHMTTGSEGNRLTGNAFVGNRTQVKYADSRLYDWSVAGRGNYWSDNPAFDLNGDGIADAAYRPNDIVDRVVWAVPLAKLLLNSPAVQVVRWAQSQFPTISPGGVVDSAPLMIPPPAPRGWRKEPFSDEGS